MSKYILTNSANTFELTLEEAEALDIQSSEGGLHHILEDGTSHAVTSVKSLDDPKTILVVMNGKEYSFTIKDDYDQLINQLGMDKVRAKKLSNISAPMPGLILDILVKEGQSFEEGDSLLILEAMKMENVIKAEGAGMVKAILNKKGDTVEKAQIIIDLEEQ